MASLTLDWLHVIALLGTIQGVFLAGVLATKRSNRTANRLLAATMLVFSISLATNVYHGAGFERVFPQFFGVGYPLPFLYGPLIYLYALTAADRSRRLTWRDALHFVPFLAVVIAALPVYLLSGEGKIAYYRQLQSGNEPLMVAVTTPLKFVSGAIYAPLTLVFLRHHREQVKDSYSSVERVNLRWLVWLGSGAAAVWALAIGLEVLEQSGIASFAREDDLIALGIAVIVYGIGYLGLRQPEVFRFDTAEHRVPAELRVAAARSTMAVEAAPAVEPAPPSPEPEAASARYERSGLSDREAQRLERMLKAAMENEHLWRDSELTLADLATRLDTTPHKLSEVLNSQLGQTFYDFVNGYRVREVQRRIAAGDAERVKMLTLALDAGFASKSTFNVVFKKHTSQTPSAYRQAASV